MASNDYDIGKAFRAIEDELIASMIRNMKHHRAWEDEEGFHWEQWQVLQLRALDEYKRKNQKIYGRRFTDINASIAAAIQEARSEGGMNQEIQILKAIKNGFKVTKASKGAAAEFFRMNDRKLDALIRATTHDMQRAETAVLRMANDQYRKVIFNAQVYANSGAGTYEKAVDMATKDFLSAGLNCVEYKNGARHTLADYADMALRTASKRAYLTGEGEKRQEWGIHTVIMNKRENPCPKCLPFVGKILIDDVWSGGSRKDGPYPLMSSAIAAGLYHPRCKDSHTTYFPGVSTPPDDKFSKKELSDIEQNTKLDVKLDYTKQQADKCARLSKYSLDSENADKYKKRELSLREKVDIFYRNSRKEISKLKSGFISEASRIENESVRTLLSQSIDRVEIKVTPNLQSRYNSREKTIYLSRMADNSTLSHELFHEIDLTYGLIENGMFGKSAKSDYSRLQNRASGYGKTIEGMLYSKYKNAFYVKEGKLKIKEKYRGISDILHGMSNAEIYLGFGHTRKKYWEKPLNLEHEIFAQCGRIIFDGDEDVMKMADEIFPDVMREMKLRLEEMIK